MTALRAAAIIVVLLVAGWTALTLSGAGLPQPSGLAGYLAGGTGFALMLMTETLYSARKRSTRAAGWGRLESWLQVHVVTGLVGPAMIVLHTAGRFHGLAGVVALLMALIVVSGFIGRYIYTSLPRGADGVELGDSDLASEIAAAEARLQEWQAANQMTLPPHITDLPPVPYNAWPIVLGRVFIEWEYRWRWLWSKSQVAGVSPKELDRLGAILARRRQLRYQAAGLVLMRRIFAAWHTVHVPLGVALFTTAAVHIVAAVYYASLAR